MTEVTSRARVEGPIMGGVHGWAFGSPLFDLADRGYVGEEYFLTGTASTYRQVAGTDWGRDGRWRAEPSDAVPYRTRILVYRPVDAQRFNGTAVVSWNNVTSGYELFGGESPEFFEGGYAFVGATVQRVGVHGFPTNSQGLAAWDPERYATLSIPTDDASYGILTDVARAVGVDRDRIGVDPLGGLDVRRVIALGASQSAGRLATYVNAIHPLEHPFDGYLLQIYFGNGTLLEVGDAIVNINTPALASSAPPAPSLSLEAMARVGLRGRNLLRDDLDVPVMVVNSELEAVACFDVRQPDTDRFRYWEAAGLSHTAFHTNVVRAVKYEREFGQPLPVDPGMNRISIVPLYDAALHHLNRWVGGGDPPPSQPLIEFDPTGVARDAHGIALGGVRMPQADVPVGVNSAIPLADDILGLLRGSSHPFGRAKLDELYGSESVFLAQFTAAAERAVAAGVLLARDVAPLVDEAAREYQRAYSSS